MKREPVEVKPLSEYVDDRLELIKQAFACLKPKTIKGITPKFLQNQSLEGIQEKCLDEVLGISKKRLLAIINDTKCPTDTESSDDDIEHISLDDISSDEDCRPKNKSAATTVKKNGNGPRKHTKDTLPVVKEEKPEEPKKEYSVLELLELQARARAIRSQLALEPVTKIELDCDEEPEKEVAQSSRPPAESKSTQSPKKRDGKSDKKSSPAKPSNGSSPVSVSKPAKSKRVAITAPDNSAPSKPVKTKRSESMTSPENDLRKRLEMKQLEKAKEKQKERSRESSPDVMPILECPVTLCISSDDEERTSGMNGGEVGAKEECLVEAAQEAPEEGEIDENEAEAEAIAENGTMAGGQDNGTTSEPIKSAEVAAVEEIKAAETEPPQMPVEVASVPLDESKDDADVLCVQLDDDCIDLECDDPMEDEEEENKGKEVNEEELVEIVDSSADEEGEEKDSASNDSKSWGERWLESSKVSKILATSKLSNQLRRKIQMSKKKQQQEATAKEVLSSSLEGDVHQDVQAAVGENSTTEVGSIGHYKDIVDRANAKAE